MHGHKLLGATALFAAAAFGCGVSQSPESLKHSRSTIWNILTEAREIPGSESAELRRSVGLLRRPPTAIPQAEEEHIRKISGAPREGLAFSKAHFQKGLWVVSGRGIVCIAEENRGNVACDLESKVARDGLSIGAFTPPNDPTEAPKRFSVTGILPDSVKHLCIQVGPVEKVIVAESNVYAVAGRQPIHVAPCRSIRR